METMPAVERSENSGGEYDSDDWWPKRVLKQVVKRQAQLQFAVRQV